MDVVASYAVSLRQYPGASAAVVCLYLHAFTLPFNRYSEGAAAAAAGSPCTLVDRPPQLLTLPISPDLSVILLQHQGEEGEAARLFQDSLHTHRDWIEQQQAAVQEALQQQEAATGELQCQLAQHAERLSTLEHSGAHRDKQAEEEAQWRQGISERLGQCAAGAEAAAQQAAAALTGCGEAAARVDSLCERLEMSERDWQRQLQVKCRAGCL
jgi:hypothetical protein